MKKNTYLGWIATILIAVGATLNLRFDSTIGLLMFIGGIILSIVEFVKKWREKKSKIHSQDN